MEEQLPSVSDEFIAENQKIFWDSFKKKGGPYSNEERRKRRNEVFRLHFELGYSATKIAESMKINRNTINSDISNLYTQLAKEWQSYDIEAWMMKQNHRMESQRNRLFEDLENTQNLKEKLAVERMISEIDNRIIQTAIKASSAHERVFDLGAYTLNRWAEENKLDVRFIHSRDLTKVTQKTHKKIEKLMAEDRKNKMIAW